MRKKWSEKKKCRLFLRGPLARGASREGVKNPTDDEASRGLEPLNFPKKKNFRAETMREGKEKKNGEEREQKS